MPVSASTDRQQAALSQFLQAVDFGGKDAKIRHRVVMLGSGVLYDPRLGRQQFQKMKDAIDGEVQKRLVNEWLVDVHWLGYPKMDAPFDAQATLSSIELNALGIQHALEYFPNAVFDFVCHSLSGLIVLYWSLNFAKPEEYRRVNSITTINSPLASYSQFAHACEAYIIRYGTLLGRPFVPSAAVDLRDGSSVSGRVSQWKLPIHLLNVYTVGDDIVPPDIARVTGKSDEFEVDGNRWRDPINRHRQALLSPEVHKKVIDTICTLHAPASISL